MKATMTMPAQSRNLPSLRVSAGQVINLVRRTSIPAAVGGTAGAWICALADQPLACCLCALVVTVCAAINYSSKKGGAL